MPRSIPYLHRCTRHSPDTSAVAHSASCAWRGTSSDPGTTGPFEESPVAVVLGRKSTLDGLGESNCSLNPRGLGGTGQRRGMVIIQGVREGTPPIV